MKTSDEEIERMIGVLSGCLRNNARSFNFVTIYDSPYGGTPVSIHALLQAYLDLAELRGLQAPQKASRA